MLQKLSSIVILLFTLGLPVLSQSSIIDKLNSEKLKTLPLDQHLFVHLNQTRVKPQDTLWFKGYAVQGPLQQASNISQTMIIALIDKDSTIILEHQFLLYQGTAEGQFILPKKIQSGYYQLVAYVSNMLNFDTKDFFRTNIEVVNTEQKDYNFSFAFDKSLYHDKDTVEMKLRAYGEYGVAHDYLPLRLGIANSKQENVKFKTDKEGYATLRFPYHLEKDKADTPAKIEISGTDTNDRPINGEVYIPTASHAIDVQLLPEGGQLVGGLLQTIAFRCVDQLGRPIDISGIILNKKGETLSSFHTLHQGMGKFLLVPEAHETYTFCITEPKQYTNTIAFPDILDKGHALSYMGNSKGSSFFKVAKNFDGDEAITAVWQMEGIVVDVQTFVLSKEYSFHFSNQSLPTGIAKLTLFDQNNEAFAERLVFIDGKDKVDLNISLSHKQYLSRDKVTVDLQAFVKDSIPLASNLSLTVTHIAEGINPLLPLPDIRDYTLLKTELAGNVYQPQQYFNDSTDDKELAYHRDLLMLTHGWRKFDWYYKLDDKLQEAYSFFNYDTYRGQVTKGKDVFPNAQIDVFTFSKSIESFDFECNDKGRFSLNPVFEGKVPPTIMIYANKKNKLSRAILTMEDREFHMRDSLLTLFSRELNPYVYQQNRSFYQNAMQEDSLFKIWDTKYIEEVTIKADRIPSESEEDLRMFRGDQVYKISQEDFDATSIEEMLFQLNQSLSVMDDRIQKFEKGEWVQIPIVVNNSLRGYEFSFISDYSTDMIECVAYVKGTSASFMYGSEAQNGVLMVWTNNYGNVHTNHTLNKNAYVSKRYNRVRTFYTPKYETQALKQLPVPDIRINMHWDNAIQTDSLGKASVSFYTSDLKGDYLINVQGVSEKNGPVFKEAVITVK
jgi:hypothetical protein